MANKTVIVRCDASPHIGAGHVMRCLTLVNAMQGDKVTFLCVECPQSLQNQIKAQGHEIAMIDNEPHALNLIASVQPDLLIIDHYGLDENFEYQSKLFCGHLIVIDDLVNRSHLCDVLINQNPYDTQSLYNDLTPSSSEKLLGVEYALLRPEFKDLREEVAIRETVKTILVFFGGGDSVNATAMALEGLQSFDDLTVNVVVGGMNPYKTSIQSICDTHDNWHYYEDVRNMGEMILQADLCLGASGSTSMERACLGLPSIVTVLADNQNVIAQPFADLGIHVNLGDVGRLTSNDWRNAIQSFIDNPQLLKTMSEKAYSLVDGEGVQRVLTTINNLKPQEKTSYLRPLTIDDKGMILQWRNSDHVRLHMHNTDIIQADSHAKWFEKLLNNTQDFDYQVFVHDGCDVGLVGFYDFDENRQACEWGFYLGEPDLPKNTGKTMGRMALNYAFTNYHELNTIKAVVYKQNARSIQFHHDLGFKVIREDDVTLYFVKHV